MTEPERLICEIMQLSLSGGAHIRSRRSIEEQIAQRAGALQDALPPVEEWQNRFGAEPGKDVRAIAAVSAFTRWLRAFADAQPMAGESLAARLAADILLGLHVPTSQSFVQAAPSLRRRAVRLRVLAERGDYFEEQHRRPSEQAQHRASLFLQHPSPDPLDLSAPWIDSAF